VPRAAPSANANAFLHDLINDVRASAGDLGVDLRICADHRSAQIAKHEYFKPHARTYVSRTMIVTVSRCGYDRFELVLNDARLKV
jgi:hypothetical protein